MKIWKKRKKRKSMKTEAVADKNTGIFKNIMY